MHFIHSALTFIGFLGLLVSAETGKFANLTPPPPLSSADITTFLLNKNNDTVATNYYPPSTITGWANSFDLTKSIWPDIDYTTGCDARRANWPAQQHIQRALGLASVWYTNSSRTDLLDIVGKAMDYWFQNDYQSDDCIIYAGNSTSKCPCGTPGFWNTNWFDQMILMPRLIGNTCLLLANNGALQTPNTRMEGCIRILTRSYSNIDQDVPTVGKMTGSNLLDVSSSGIALSLLTKNGITLQASYTRFFGELDVSTNTTGDGIKLDGSFMQHDAQLYTGNYGKDYINSIARTLGYTSNTPMTITEVAKKAYGTLISGTEWMIIANSRNNSLLWQYSTLGRMISFAAADHQASGGVNVDFNLVARVTSKWKNAKLFADVAKRLSVSSKSANQGPLNTVRYFYDSEYMVFRGMHYVVTLKMYSSRTTNSECNNNQNPYGFHLSDGSIFTYVNGDEYVDVFGTYDWYHIPGTTVNLGGTPLTCNDTQWVGVEDFVGGVMHNNEAGIAVMNYTNPMTHNLHWSKTYFFFSDAYAVQIMDVQSNDETSVVDTTLDQRHQNGTVWVAKPGDKVGQTIVGDYNGAAEKLWHDRVGYTFLDSKTNLNVRNEIRQGNWSEIGISTGTDVNSVFQASFQNDEPSYGYVAQVGINERAFKRQRDLPIELCQGDNPVVRGAHYARTRTTALAFWTAGSHKTPWDLEVTSDQPILVVIQKIEEYHWKISVSDPTQKLEKVRLQITPGILKTAVVNINLPTGLRVGKTVSRRIIY